MSDYLLSSRSEHRSTTMTATKSILTPLAGERKSINPLLRKDDDNDKSAPASPASTSSSSSSSTSSPNNTTTNSSSRRKKKVNFLIKAEIQHVVLRSEIPKEEFEAAWYSPKEYKSIKKGLVPLLKKMAKGLPTLEDECTRGLEHKTPQGIKKRCDNRYIALDAVLQEQDRQWEFDRNDPIAISKVYNQSSAHCSMQAYLTAKADEEYVLKEVQGMQEESDDENRDDVNSSPKDEGVSIEDENVVAAKPVVAPPTKVILGVQTTRVLSAAA